MPRRYMGSVGIHADANQFVFFLFRSDLWVPLCHLRAPEARVLVCRVRAGLIHSSGRLRRPAGCGADRDGCGQAWGRWLSLRLVS